MSAFEDHKEGLSLKVFFASNVYILLSAKLTEQKNIAVYRSSKNPILLEGQLNSRIDQISSRLL